MTSREIIEAALALPEAERVQIIEELSASIPDEMPAEIVAVFDERIARVRAGEPGIPADEVFARLRAR